MIEPYIETIASQGLLGVILVIVGVGYYRKDKQCGELQEKRFCDMKEVKDQYTTLTTTIASTLDKLTATIEGRGR